MKFAVTVFPGTNCEHDIAYALGNLGATVDLVWHRETSLAGYDGVVLPGGFAHGDYLRTGAIAARSPIMAEVAVMATAGAPVVGICNGFQILCEAGLLPGALVANRDLRFICRPVHVRVEHSRSALTSAATAGSVLQIPLNSYEGNWVADGADLAGIEERGHVILRYCNAAGNVDDRTSPNGSTRSVAGLCNEAGNVAGFMPHPERAAADAPGSKDGDLLLRSMLTSVPAVR
ncbi:MAG: phosphoribosylformylglycinamidine synthase subunit PurQ [Acidimicrobiia bacterium]